MLEVYIINICIWLVIYQKALPVNNISHQYFCSDYRQVLYVVIFTCLAYEIFTNCIKISPCYFTHIFDVHHIFWWHLVFCFFLQLLHMELSHFSQKNIWIVHIIDTYVKNWKCSSMCFHDTHIRNKWVWKFKNSTL